MKKFLSLALVLTFSLILLSSCNFIKDTQAADLMLKDFVSALVNKDYEGASAYIHPDVNINANDLKAMVEDMEATWQMNLSSGVEYVELTQMYTNYSATVIPKTEQTTYKIGYKVLIDGRKFDLNAVVFKSGDVMGIYTFKLTSGIGF